MNHTDYKFGGRIRPKEEEQTNWTNLVELANKLMAFIYQRLSTHEQVKRSIYSIKAQDALEDLAKENGYTEEQIHIEKRDLGISGTKGREEREGLAYLIECIERGLVESVYVVHISRLFRNQTLIDAFAFGELCKKHGIIIVTPHMRLNLRDKMHMRLYRMEVERAADELELMQSRLGGARDMKGRQGHYAGESLPTGYVVDMREQIEVNGVVMDNPDHQKMRPYEPHAETVRTLFRLAFRGKTSTQIARYCEKAGIAFPPFPPELETGANLKTFHRLKRNLDGSWPVISSRVHSILRNPSYIGWRIWAGEVVSRDNHPPIIDEATFWAVQEQFGACDKRPKGETPPLPLAGLLFCGNHDIPRQMIYCNDKSAPPGSYHCRSIYAEGFCCKISAYILDTAICEAVISQCAYPELADQVLEDLVGEYEQAQQQAASHKRELKRLEQEVENLEHNFALKLSPERAAWIEREIEARMKKFRELSSLEHNPVGRMVGPKITDEDVKLVKSFLADLQIGWDAQPNDLKNSFLNLALERVVIHPNKETIRTEIFWRTGLRQELLIHRRHRKRRWAEAEDALLREHFETTSIPGLLEMFPGRSWSSIYQHARTKLGLTRPDMIGGTGRREEKMRRWTEEEDTILREYYDGEVTWAELTSRVDRPPKAFRARAHRLGLRCQPKARWEWLDKGMIGTTEGWSAPPTLQ